MKSIFAFLISIYFYNLKCQVYSVTLSNINYHDVYKKSKKEILPAYETIGFGGFLVNQDTIIVPGDRVYFHNLDGSFKFDSSLPEIRHSLDIIYLPNKSYLWTQNNFINIVDPMNSKKSIITGADDIRGLAYVSSSQEVYYSEKNLKKIYKLNLDGSNKTEILSLTSGIASITGLDIDEINRKIYWANTGQSKIQRSNLDGSMIEDVLLNINEIANVVVNAEKDQLFYSARKMIGTCKLDGSNNQILVNSDLISANFIQYDKNSNILYWTDGTKGSLEQLNLTDSIRTGLISNYINTRFKNIAYDKLNNLIFVRSDKDIIRLQPDGSYAQKFKVTEDNSLTPSICIDVINKVIYYLNSFNQIFSINYDGSNNSEIFNNISRLQNGVRYIKLDGRNKMLLFVEQDSIFHFDLTNYNIKAFKNPVSNDVRAFDVDLVNRKIYLGPASGKIYKMDLDGQNAEAISNTTPYAIYVNPIEEYLLYERNSVIYKSDLDGNNEELIAGQTFANSIVGTAESAYFQLPITKLTNSTDNNKVKINWTLDASFNGLSPNKIGEFTIEKLMNNNWQSIGNLDYFDTQVNYEFIDNNPTQGKNIYRIIHISSKTKLTSLSQRINVDFTTSLELDNKYIAPLITVSNYSIQCSTNIQNLYIQSIDGKIVFEIKNAKANCSIKLTNELKGIYVASFEIKGVKKSQKLIF